MKSFGGKKVLVTGAASGIGRAIVLGLAGEGTALWLIDIDRPGLAVVAATARQQGVEVVGWACDLSDAGQTARAIAALLACGAGSICSSTTPASPMSARPAR